MNAQAIREEAARVSKILEQHPEARSIFGVLGEIAAQLADVSESLKRIARPNGGSPGGWTSLEDAHYEFHLVKGHFDPQCEYCQKEKNSQQGIGGESNAR
jgi:hypothetical protein